MDDECNIEMLSSYVVVDEDQFLAFSKVGADGFQYVLASKGLLLLYDVRTPMVPLLCWAHNLDNPCFIDVIRLLKLRSQSRDDTYQWATKSYFCIMLGSFWNCEFKLFCYGPSSANEGYLATEKFCKPFLSRDLSKLVCELDEFGGFILIRLMSLEKIEAQ
ncbi:WD repeat and FYVE domain-containing protein 3 [Gossypium australe]|uniref:WD repeat and FYVE domain-containing protein 3 n=1 Tax=Gossypium australe TaxID=47621 RepID=A0A5B6WQF3_9ROSI|nr:WD repeat and FYVE domain-containing protein 3 [Gossypium australe]